MEEKIMDMDKRINSLMAEHHLFGEIVEENAEIKMIGVEITWGDWKHDHIRLDWIMTENFKNLRSIHTMTTEEDGSDCYSAIHYYYFS